MKKLTLAALCLYAIALPAHAAAENDKAAIGMVDTFDQSCLAYAGRMAQLRVWADANLKVANERQSPQFLGQMPGKVWLKKSPEGNYALIVYDLGLCTVKAERAPIDDALTYFAKTAAPALHYTITDDGNDANGMFNDIAGRVQSYGVMFDGVKYEIIASGTQDGGAVLQSQMTLMHTASVDDDDDDDVAPVKK